MSGDFENEQYDSWDDDLREHQKSRYKAGGKKFGYFYKLTEVPVRFHFVKPEKPYLHPVSGRRHQFRTGFRHFIKGKGKGKGVFIECGDKLGKPCVVHAYSYPEKYGLTNVKPDVSLKQFQEEAYFAVGGFIEEDFHLVKKTLEDGKEVTRREFCTGRGCEECTANSPYVFGKKSYLEISPGQWQHAFHPINKRIENSSCACGGDLFVSSFVCAGCGKIVLDVSTTCDRCHSQDVVIDVSTKQAKCESCQRTWSAVYTDHKQLYEDSLEPYSCKTCKHEGFLKAEKFCSIEGCSGVPLSIFDVQLTLHKSGEGNQSRISIDSYVIQPPDERLFLPEHQGGDEMAEKVVEAHKKSLDLEYLLQPKSVEDQCHDLGKPDPFTAGSQTTQRYVRYEGEGSKEPPTER